MGRGWGDDSGGDSEALGIMTETSSSPFSGGLGLVMGLQVPGLQWAVSARTQRNIITDGLVLSQRWEKSIRQTWQDLIKATGNNLRFPASRPGVITRQHEGQKEYRPALVTLSLLKHVN